VLLVSTLQRSLRFSNIKIFATFAGDFLVHTYCFTLLSVEAAAVNLVAAGAFLLVFYPVQILFTTRSMQRLVTICHGEYYTVPKYLVCQMLQRCATLSLPQTRPDAGVKRG